MISHKLAIAATAVVIAAGVPAATANCTAANAADCVYANCTAAKDADVCDIPRDDPAYCPKQDRDDDGIACECSDW
jgi:hypothetical protein